MRACVDVLVLDRDGVSDGVTEGVDEEEALAVGVSLIDMLAVGVEICVPVSLILRVPD